MNNFTQLIRHGKYTDSQKARVIEHISRLKVDEKLEYEIIVKRYVESKTKAQLGYYFGVIIPHLMEFQGCSSKDADIALKDELVPPTIVQVLGKTIQVRASIAEMKINEMSEYIDLCINFLGSWGINIPLPPYKSGE